MVRIKTGHMKARHPHPLKVSDVTRAVATVKVARRAIDKLIEDGVSLSVLNGVGIKELIRAMDIVRSYGYVLERVLALEGAMTKLEMTPDEIKTTGKLTDEQQAMMRRVLDREW